MNMYNDKLFPIGTIIKLKRIDENILIVGYMAGNYETGFYDYVGCYQEKGLFADSAFNKDYINFNGSDIEKVKFMGFQNQEYNLLAHALLQAKTEVERYKSQNNGTIEEDKYLEIVLKASKEWFPIGGKNE